jgi:hypothetical protein
MTKDAVNSRGFAARKAFSIQRCGRRGHGRRCRNGLCSRDVRVPRKEGQQPARRIAPEDGTPTRTQ